MTAAPLRGAFALLALFLLTLPLSMRAAAEQIAARRAGSEPPATREDWAREASEWFAHSGVVPEVPRSKSGEPLTRYEFAVRGKRVLDTAEQDWRKACDLWVNDPVITQEQVVPDYLRETKSLLRWTMDRLEHPASIPEPAAANCCQGPGLFAFRSGFPDIPPAHPASEAVRGLARRGIFTGFEDGTFHGEGRLTPRELAVAVQRLTQEIQRVSGCTLGMRKAVDRNRTP